MICFWTNGTCKTGRTHPKVTWLPASLCPLSTTQYTAETCWNLLQTNITNKIHQYSILPTVPSTTNCVDKYLDLPQFLYLPLHIECPTSSGGISTPKSPRATITPSDASRMPGIGRSLGALEWTEWNQFGVRWLVASVAMCLKGGQQVAMVANTSLLSSHRIHHSCLTEVESDRYN